MPPAEPLPAVLRRLLDSGRDYAQAEIDRQKLRALMAGATARDVAILAVVAVVLLLCSLITLMVGLVLALSPYLTPLGATALVAGMGLVAVVMLALAAQRKVRSFLEGLSSED